MAEHRETTARAEARRASADALAENATRPVDALSRPRLTPQNRADSAAAGEDATSPSGVGAQEGQADPAEGSRRDGEGSR